MLVLKAQTCGARAACATGLGGLYLIVPNYLLLEGDRIKRSIKFSSISEHQET
jgi:hypothetical protein